MKTITATEAVKKLAEENGGQISPELVLELARPKNSALHPFFEWDDAKASEQYRLVQAARIIRSIKVEISIQGGESVRIRAFHNVAQTSGEHGRIYVNVDQALGVESYRDQIIQQCRQDIAVFQAKYAAIAEAGNIIAAMSEFAA